MSDSHNVFATHDCTSFNLGTLAAESTISVALLIDAARTQGVQILKMKAHWAFHGKISGEGPIVIGFATGLTDAEITEAFRADPQHRMDTPGNEHSRRKMYVWAVINRNATVRAGENTPDAEYKELKDFPKWNVIQGQQLHLFAHNCASQALTTGLNLFAETRISQRWLLD